jgi:hypothetical protein
MLWLLFAAKRLFRSRGTRAIDAIDTGGTPGMTGATLSGNPSQRKRLAFPAWAASPIESGN